ncbi:MAG: malto-oligosyltrehalose trehalohydrolase [Halanaerobiales bacterium]
MTINMGASIIGGKEKRIKFRVFAYDKQNVGVIIKSGGNRKEFPLIENKPDIYSGEIPLRNIKIEHYSGNNSLSSTTVKNSTVNYLLYKFKIEGKAYPDPYSNFQPQGVSGFSQLIDHEQYQWHDRGWDGIELEKFIIMEIHIGTFSKAGTFQGVIKKLNYLKELGINAIELMPVNQTPGRWNWGYDGTGLFTVNHNYGTPDDLKQLVDCCHQKNMAVILDVVYNHFGPEGNFLPAYGPYFTEKHHTPWGPAVNYDDNYSQFTRKMILDNVCYWLELFHLDGLRLDAVQAISDESPEHILKCITAAARKTSAAEKRKIYIIAETDQNDVKLINPPKKGGYGLDAQWMDDFHHCVHTVLTDEDEGYYIDYGRPEDFQKVYKNYLYTGEYSKYWGRNRGTSAADNPGKQFVVAIQNHDQIGNRARGERLSTLVDFPYLKAAAGLMFIAAYIPLIFMGEEYGEQNPFLFFTDYGEPELQKAVTEGRKEEFENFTWKDVPDPQDENTFYKSKLTPPDSRDRENHQLFNFYRDLINLRRDHPVLKNPDKKNLAVEVNKKNMLLKIKRWNETCTVSGYFNLGENTVLIDNQKPGKEIFNSNYKIYGGSNYINRAGEDDTGKSDEDKGSTAYVNTGNQAGKVTRSKKESTAENDRIIIHGGQMILFDNHNTC